jgi:Fur family transcriptional regulator, ferric uptake regulator
VSRIDNGAVAEPAEKAKRNTRQGAAVEQTMRRADGFRTAQEIFADVSAQGHRVGLTTVYRHLNLLAAQGRADVVHRDDGEAQFRLCGENDQSEHHHHVVCRICGRSVEVSGPEVERWADRVATAAGYTDVTHTLEVFGVCPRHTKRKRSSR